MTVKTDFYADERERVSNKLDEVQILIDAQKKEEKQDLTLPLIGILFALIGIFAYI